MKAGGGKSKGSSFERDIARYLTKWLTGQDKELYFWRSPSSGAVATINEMNGDISGDIIALKTEAKCLVDMFSIELKCGYKDADLSKHLKKTKNNTIKSFWDQCIRDSRMANGKYGMLIFKKDREPTIVGIEKDTIMEKLMSNKIKNTITLSYKDLPSVVFYDFIDFFDTLKPEQLKGI